MRMVMPTAQDTDEMDLSLHSTRFSDITVTPRKSVYDRGEDVTFRGLLEWRDAFFRWLPIDGREVELYSNGSPVGVAYTDDKGRFVLVHRLPTAHGRYLYRMYFAGQGFPHFLRSCWSDPIPIRVEGGGDPGNDWYPPPDTGVPWERVMIYSAIGIGALTAVLLIRRVVK